MVGGMDMCRLIDCEVANTFRLGLPLLWRSTSIFQLAETTNGLYKTECVFGPDAPRPWDDVDEIELATLSWVHWFNDQRLHGHCGDIPSAEFEMAIYAAQLTDPTGVGIK